MKCSIGLATCCNSFARLILLLWVVIVVGNGPVLADPPLTVALHQMVQVENHMVTLNNVAQVFGSDMPQVTRLGNIPLGRAPALGSQRTLTRQDIKKYWKRAGVAEDAITIIGADQVLISRACDTITPEIMALIIEQYLMEQLLPRGIQYQWDYAKEPKPFAIPAGASVEIMNKPADRLQGSVFLQVGVRHQGSLKRKTSIRVEIATSETLWVAKETIPRGTRISSDMISTQLVETTSMVGNPRAHVESIIGYQAKRTIPPGRIITSDMIDVPYAVHRGDLVTITAYGDLVVACVDGQARENGRPGEWIWVVNMLTNGKMKAQVVDAQTVVIQ